MINDLLVEDLFKEEIKNSFVLHIPHSSKLILDKTGFVEERLEKELNLLTDHATDKIFETDGVSSVIFPYSRIFCDVERLDDENEEMFKYGRGFYYTKTDDGQELRKLNENHKLMIYNRVYSNHHNRFNKLVNSKLEKYGFVNIIDCHSFTDKPFESDIDKSENRPDICIGTDPYHTPVDLFNKIANIFKSENYSVGHNSPYSGTIVPLQHYKKSKNINSIMIEINRKLYMDGDVVIDQKVKHLNTIISKIFE